MSRYFKIPIINNEPDMDNESYEYSEHGIIQENKEFRIDKFPDNFNKPRNSWIEVTREEYLTSFPTIIESETGSGLDSSPTLEEKVDALGIMMVQLMLK
jgi:hypothetical protein